jgi:hypothetical protein
VDLLFVAGILVYGAWVFVFLIPGGRMGKEAEARAREEMLEFWDQVELGDIEEEVLLQFSQANYKIIRMRELAPKDGQQFAAAVDVRDIYMALLNDPIEDWHLLLEFGHDDRLSAMRFRLGHGYTKIIDSAPPDRVLPVR